MRSSSAKRPCRLPSAPHPDGCLYCTSFFCMRKPAFLGRVHYRVVLGIGKTIVLYTPPGRQEAGSIRELTGNGRTKTPARHRLSSAAESAAGAAWTAPGRPDIQNPIVFLPAVHGSLYSEAGAILCTIS